MAISYQKPFVISVSAFCFQIFTLTLNLRPKIGLTNANSTVKRFFFYFLSKKIFLLFFAEFKLLMFHNNILKISEKIEKAELVENLRGSYLPYRFLHNLRSFLLWEQVKKFDFKNTMTRKNILCAHLSFQILRRDLVRSVVTTNGFALNNKIPQIYFCLKRQAKNKFLKDVKNTVEH